MASKKLFACDIGKLLSMLNVCDVGGINLHKNNGIGLLTLTPRTIARMDGRDHGSMS